MRMIDCRELVGIPYKDGGRTKDGLDCFGLNLMVSKMLGYEVQDWRYGDNANRDKQLIKLVKNGLSAEKIDTPVEGCYIEFSCVDRFHTGVYIGNGQFIHASKTAGMVVIESLDKWSKRIKGYYNVHN